MVNITILVVTIICFLLIVSSIMKFISKRSKIPLTIFLVVVGIILSYLAKGQSTLIEQLTNYTVYPNILLYVCLPALIFEATFTMDGRMLRKNILPILILSIPGLLVSMTVIALILHNFTSFSLVTAFLLGSILSSIDSVTIVSIFRQLGVPKRLAILVEGESLFNSTTAFVVVKTLLFVMGMQYINTENLLIEGIYEFCWNFFGGIFVGIILAFIINILISLADDESIVIISLTISLAYLSFIIAEYLGVSGVMATISSSVVMADLGRTKISQNTEKSIKQFLGFIAYLVNSLIFILVGFSVNFQILYNSWLVLVVALIAMLIARGIMVFGLSPLICRLPNMQPINFRYQIISWMSGIQGALGITLALTLSKVPEHELLVSIVMGVAISTIIMQGSIIGKLIHWLKLDVPSVANKFITLEAEIAADNSTLARIPKLQNSGLFSLKIAKALKDECKKRIDANNQALAKLRTSKINHFKERRLSYLSCFAREKFVYFDLLNKGHVSEQAYRILNHNVDMRIDAMRYHGTFVKKSPTTFSNFLIVGLMNFLKHFSMLKKFSNWLRIHQTIIDYEVQWGTHEGCLAILNYLDELEENKAFKKKLLDKARDNFMHWLDTTAIYLNEVAEQFPEFVNDMQRRQALRIVLFSKSQTITNLVEQGLLPAGIGQRIIEQYTEEIHQLSKENPAKLQLESQDLLKRIPFFKKMSKDELVEAVKLFTIYHAQAEEVIIRQGTEDDSLFLIIRGVVRITKKRGNKPQQIATLIAGDFFGELAMLHKIKRTATCKTVTPCMLYVLKREDFLILAKRYPSIQKMLDETGKKRTNKNA